MSASDETVEEAAKLNSADAEAHQTDEAASENEDTTSGLPTRGSAALQPVQPAEDPPVENDALVDVKQGSEKLTGETRETVNGNPLHAEEVDGINSKPLPTRGSDFGVDSTTGLKDATLLKPEDLEPVIRGETHTPDFARVAAEVGDSAATLDRRSPTPPITDEEAGQTGFRRMSQTPIPEVAKTAAEVADSAAIVDKEEHTVRRLHAHQEQVAGLITNVQLKIDIPVPIIDIEDPDSPGSGTVTPWEERAPRFAHECPRPPSGQLRPASHEHYEGKGPRDPFENSAIDLDDPSIEEFPSEREAIYEQVRSCQRRLSEDQTSVEALSPSPVVVANNHHERFDLPSPSPKVLTRTEDRSPSLMSIPEEQGNSEDELSALPTAVSQPDINLDLRGVGGEDQEDTAVAVKEVAAGLLPSEIVKSPSQNPAEEQIEGLQTTPDPDVPPSTPPALVDGKQPGEREGNSQKIFSPVEGPSITVLPATPGTSLKARASDQSDIAKTTAIDEGNGHTQLTARKTASPVPDRPLTPSSMRSAGKEAKSKNFLKSFLKLVFVDWIGGLIARLCGGGRHT